MRLDQYNQGRALLFDGKSVISLEISFSPEKLREVRLRDKLVMSELISNHPYLIDQNMNVYQNNDVYINVSR